MPRYPPVSCRISAQSYFSLLPTSLKKPRHGVVPCCLCKYSVRTCHGRPVLFAAGFYFVLKSQAVQQEGSPGNSTVRRLVWPHEERALWLHVRGVPCLPAYLGARKGREFKELCVPGSCKNVVRGSLPVHANSSLSSSPRLLACFQPSEAGKAGNNCLLLT